MASLTKRFSMLMVIFKLLFVASRVKSVSAACESLQYAEFGQQGIIECNFIPGFTGVYWYLHVETGYQIIIRLEKQDDGSLARYGAGYIEKKFDIVSNGNLILTNVSDFHNQSFKVVHVDEDLRVEEIFVELVISILPDQKFPLISACNGSNLCFVEDIQSHILTCSFYYSKPAVNLTWYKLSPENPEALQGKTLISEDGEWTFSSVLKTNITSYINGQLTAFSCRAFSPALKSHFTESIVIIDTTKQSWPSLEGNVVEEKYVIRNSEAKVHCTETVRPHILVWKEFHRHSSHVLGFAANGTTRTVSDHKISHDGSLTFARVKLEDEGLYWCKLSDGFKYESNLKQVKVFVPPVPPEIFVAECPSYENECEVLIQNAPLRISCYLNGVYPNVTLNMKTTSGRELRIINQTTYRTGRGNLFNATITKEISPMDCSTSLIIRCQISNPVSLDFIPEKLIVLRSEECKESGSTVAAVVIAVVVVGLLIIVILGIILHWRVFRHKVKDNGIEENVSEKESMLEESVSGKNETETPLTEELEETTVSEKESMLEESVSGKNETETPLTEELEETTKSNETEKVESFILVETCEKIADIVLVSEKESMLEESVSGKNETETPLTEELEETTKPNETEKVESFILVETCEKIANILLFWSLSGITEVFPSKAVNAFQYIIDTNPSSHNESEIKQHVPSFMDTFNLQKWRDRWYSSKSWREFIWNVNSSEAEDTRKEDQLRFFDQFESTLKTFVELQESLLHVVSSIAIAQDILTSVSKNSNFSDDNYSTTELTDIQGLLQSLKCKRDNDEDLRTILANIDEHIKEFFIYLDTFFLEKEERSLPKYKHYRRCVQGRKKTSLASLKTVIPGMLKHGNVKTHWLNQKGATDGLNLITFVTLLYASSHNTEDVDVTTMQMNGCEKTICENIARITAGVIAARKILDSRSDTTNIDITFLGSTDPTTDIDDEEDFQRNATMIIETMKRMNTIANMKVCP